METTDREKIWKCIPFWNPNMVKSVVLFEERDTCQPICFMIQMALLKPLWPHWAKKALALEKWLKTPYYL